MATAAGGTYFPVYVSPNDFLRVQSTGVNIASTILPKDPSSIGIIGNVPAPTGTTSVGVTIGVSIVAVLTAALIALSF